MKKDPKNILVEDVMIRKPKTATMNESTVSAFETVVKMRTALPVVSEDKLVGLFTFHDALAYYLKTFEEHDSR